MANFEYDFSDKDYKLVATNVPSSLNETDYVRIIVYNEDGPDIVRLSGNNQAIFYSSLNSQPFEINISPFGAQLDEILSRNIGGNFNDFQIYKNQNGNIYLKPNEIFNTFGLPEGRYKIQIDSLNQLNEVINYRFDNLNVNNSIKSFGNQTINDGEYNTLLEKPPYSYNANLSNNVLSDEYLNSQITQSPNDNILLWTDDTIPIEEIRTHFSTNFNESADFLETLPFPQYFEEFNATGDGALNIVDANYWRNNGRPDIADKITQDIINQTLPQTYIESLPFPQYREEFDIAPLSTMGDVIIENGDGILDVIDADVWANIGRSDIAEYLTPLVNNVQTDTIPSAGESQERPIEDFIPNLEVIQPIETFLGTLVEEPIVGVISSDKSAEYRIPSSNDGNQQNQQGEGEGFQDPEFSWYGNLEFLEKGKLYTIVIDSSISDYLLQIRDNTNLIPDLIYTPNNDILVDNFYQFIIKEISTSRKEVRIKMRDRDINGKSVDGLATINHITNTLNNNTDEFQFNHILNLGTGNHFKIMNYMFDSITDGKENQSIIIKLYEPLPTTISNLSYVTIEEEKLITQVQDITYFSEEGIDDDGDGLIPDSQQNWLTIDSVDNNFETFNELSSSVSSISLNNLISSSEYNYPNLNTNFNEFENHTFFGSAKAKLKNFKAKVETIQGHYSDISSSLYAKGVVLGGDSTTLIDSRKNLFNKINQEIQSFTPYESFLYFDGQIETTASAPGLTRNYADSKPLSENKNDGGFVGQLNLGDGFDSVYHYSNTGTALANGDMTIIANKYLAQGKPFFNYSSSIYLSLLAKGESGSRLELENTNDGLFGAVANGMLLPHDTLHTSSIVEPELTGSEYRRYIFKVSSSYFVPSSNVSNRNVNNISDFSAGSNQIEILSGSTKSISSQIRAAAPYIDLATVVTGSGAPFKGSIMPAGDLLYLKGKTTSSSGVDIKIADVKISLKNPTNVLPFDNLYHTSSAEWTSWYNGMYDLASSFDTDNIHSLENNLPTYIQESSEYDELKDFLSLQGEQYDIIKNHIDSLGTLNDRGYKETNSPPSNTYPMLLENLGFEAINPFSGSLTDSLGTYLSGVTSIDDIKNATWRKTLNNLLYIYKSKGTKNSVRGLLNVYGYPPDVLKIQEFGSSNNNLIDDGIIDNNAGNDLNLGISTGSLGIITKKRKIYHYNFNTNKNRRLPLDWWMDSANINTFEFVYKNIKSSDTQTILKSSGSGTETLWDLRLVPDSEGISSSFEFRLNNSLTGSSDIAINGISMSTDYITLGEGQLWNVMFQRVTTGATNTAHEYRLHASYQENDKILKYNYVTMSVDGTAAAGERANYNYFSTGSRHALSSSNLFVGYEFSGSIAEIKSWTTALSASRYKQHTLNKFSIIGNSINSYEKELIYHFKLNENYTTSSVSSSSQPMIIKDSAPKCNLLTDYSIRKSGSLFTDSNVYGYDLIDVVTLGLQDNNLSNENDNKVIINPSLNYIGDLNSEQIVTLPFGANNERKIFTNSAKLELFTSPQNTVDEHILNNFDTFNFEKYYGNPLYYNSASYTEFDNLRKEFFRCNPIEVDTNKYIRAHENMFNSSIVDGLKTLAPARSTMSDEDANMGVLIKPNILEKQKHEVKKNTLEVNPNTSTGSINVVSVTNVISSKFEDGNLDVKHGTVLTAPSTSGSDYQAPITMSISLGNSYSSSDGYIHPSWLQPIGYSSSIDNPYAVSISIPPSTSDSVMVSEKTGLIDYASIANESFVNIHNSWGTSSNDTHFINYAGITGSNGDYNIGHIDTRFNFISIGEVEIYSSSVAMGDNFTDSTRFYNRELLKDGVYKNITYESFINGNPGLQTGVALGKTRYFFTGSDGTITLPSNHVSKFSNPFKETMYNGAQNTNPGFLNFQYEDYSSASFYSVKVTGGENQIKVGGGNPSRDGNNKIIYN